MTGAHPNPSSIKPVRLSASATLTLPRWGLLLLCLLYILPGLFWRDPWKQIDASHFGVMWTMSEGGLWDWLLPHLSGEPLPNGGPLTFWLGALCIKLFGGFIGAVNAARIATLAFFLLAAYCVWRTAYVLGRRTAAQPMRLAFGGQPDPADYGRVLADGALLIYLGCLGLNLFSHETSINALYVALVALTLYRTTCLIQEPGKRNAILLGFALGCLALTNGLLTPVALFLGFFFIAFLQSQSRPQLFFDLLLAVGIAMLVMLPWILLSRLTLPYYLSPVADWLNWNAAQISLPSLSSGHFFAKYAIWGFWPAWPFACWAIYAWRRQWREPHVMIPLLFTVVFFLLAILSFQKEETLMLAMFPPLCILAAFGLPTMRRGAINAVDWFSVLSFTLIAAVIWVCWIAAQFGWPPKIARNALKLAPGFVPELSLGACIVAMLATISWFILVYWRISRQPSVLWRAVVLSSGGVILCWLLLATLWLPWINYNKSYARVAIELGNHIPDREQCVDSNVGLAQRASFAYFGQVKFSGKLKKESCSYRLIQDSVPKRAPRTASPQFQDDMKLLWEGHRPSDRTERFRLYEYRKQP